MNGSNRDVGLDNFNVGDGENKADLGDVNSGGRDSNDDVGVDDIVWIITNSGTDDNFGNGDSKFECGDDINGGDRDNKDAGDVDDDGDVDSPWLTLKLVMMLTVIMAGAKLIEVKIQLVIMVIVILMVVSVMMMMMMMMMMMVILIMIIQW